jgi:ADP-ribose pyrophosphatase YjhB (NUDIX family)
MIECKPRYLYDQPMFMITVHTVIIEDNGVLLTKCHDRYDFPGGMVRASQESIVFAALRHIKEQTGILFRKDELIPVDFRSSPDRSAHGNVIDLGFVVVAEKDIESNKAYRVPVDFENKKILLENREYISAENKVLFERALDVILMLK